LELELMNSVGVTDGIVLNSGLEGKSSSYLKKYYQRLRPSAAIQCRIQNEESIFIVL
jgi:hypothetical protein